jgi:hypothetical protein
LTTNLARYVLLGTIGGPTATGASTPGQTCCNNGDCDGDRPGAEEHQPLLISRCAYILYIEDPRHEHAAFQTWQRNEQPGQVIDT